MFKGEKIKLMARKGAFFKEFVWNRIMVQMRTNLLAVWVSQKDSVHELGKLDEKKFMAEMEGVKPLMVG